jgi:hypothetical protein
VKQFLRVQFINKVGGIAMKTRLNDEQKKTLAAKMKAKLAALDAKEKRERERRRAARTAPLGSESAERHRRHSVLIFPAGAGRRPGHSPLPCGPLARRPVFHLSNRRH